MAKSAFEAFPIVEYRPHDEPTAGIEICDLESLYKRSPNFEVDPYDPHRVQFHHLIYISDGAGTHFVDFDRHNCQPGSFILINQNQIHAFDGENRPLGKMILFTQDFLDSIYASMRLPSTAFGFRLVTSSPVLTVSGEAKASCEALLSEIVKVTGEAPHDRLVIQLLLASMFLKLRQQDHKSREAQPNEEMRQRLLRFMSLIETNFHATKDAATYAQMMGVTYKTLNDVCKRTVSKTPKQLIDAHTILEAKRRLAIDSTQISQLAYDLGFKEATNFVKYFKKHTSQTPSQFQHDLPS